MQASVAVSRGVRNRVPCAVVVAKRAVRVSILAIRMRAALLVDEAAGPSASTDESFCVISGCVSLGVRGGHDEGIRNISGDDGLGEPSSVVVIVFELVDSTVDSQRGVVDGACEGEPRDERTRTCDTCQ